MFQALTICIEVPAMERAAKAVFFQPAITKISATMGAMASDQAKCAAFIAKQHQLFTEQGYGYDRAFANQLVA